jgi:sugar phosphate isomerase/epimerase
MIRRKFLQLTGTSLAGFPLLDGLASSFMETNPWGVQLFTIPKLVENDLPGTLQWLGKIGYREVEFFGPYAFSAPEVIKRWETISAQLGIKKNAFYGYSVNEVKGFCKDANLKTPSVHLDIITMRKNMGPAMEALANLGARYVAIPALIYPEERVTLDDYKKLADEFNLLGEKMNTYGLTFVYHNHGYEHAIKDGKCPMDILLTRTDSKYVKFELDIFWMKAAGAEPIDYLKRYPGKYKLMHVKDALEPVRFSGDGGTSDQWMQLFPKMADPGRGVFDIRSIVTQARQSGVDHFFLERDLAPDPEKTLKDSYRYLSGI